MRGVSLAILLEVSDTTCAEATSPFMVNLALHSTHLSLLVGEDTHLYVSTGRALNYLSS